MLKVRNRTWLMGLALLLVLAGIPFASLRLMKTELAIVESVRHNLSQALGADVTIDGPIEAHLFPRPYIELSNLRFRTGDGYARLDIPKLKATQTLASILTGQVHFTRLQLIDPTATIDADQLSTGPIPRDAGDLIWALPAKVVVLSGVVVIRSANPAIRGIAADLNAVVDGLDKDAAASVSGRGSWHGQHAEFNARLDPVFDFFLGRPTEASLKIRSPLLSVSLAGVLHAGLRGRFDGNVTASTTSLATLLRTNDITSSLGSVVRHASFSGSGVQTADSLAFSNTRITLNATDFEGSLAWQRDEGRTVLTGTLATDLLDLTPILDVVPNARDEHGAWSNARWPIDPSVWRDVDLRVSANRATLGPVEAEDAAFSILCRDGRMEMSLGEARSFDGLVKGRAVASVASDKLDVRLDMSVSRIDMDGLSKALLDSTIVGSASGHFSGEAHGDNARSLIESMDGHGHIDLRQGKLPGFPAITDLLHPEANPSNVPSGDDQPFDLASTDFHVAGGILKIDDGNLASPEARLAFRGEASLMNQSFDLSSVAFPVDGSSAPPPAPTSLVGTWGRQFRVIKLGKADPKTWRPSMPLPPTEFFP